SRVGRSFGKDTLSTSSCWERSMSNGDTGNLLQATDVSLEGYVWLEGLGAVEFADNYYAGTRDQGRRMEGFEVNLVNPPGQLGLRYQVYASDLAWMPPVDGGQYAGTKDQGLALQAFWIHLVNTEVPDGYFTLFYMTHQQDNGDVYAPEATTDDEWILP